MDFTADLPLFYADFGQFVTHHPAAGGYDTVGRAILDLPGMVLIGGEQLATDYGLRYPAATFPAVKRGDTFTVGAVVYTAREAAQPIGVDGLEHAVPLAR
jgi:hypothetical protein